nr:MAG TPA: ECF sigma factor [Caudoviricetes sp.]
MATPKIQEQKELKESKENNLILEFTKPELDYIKENANFTIEELNIFEMLTGKYGRETIVYIANKMNLSTATISRRIRKIKNKIKKLI